MHAVEIYEPPTIRVEDLQAGVFVESTDTIIRVHLRLRTLSTVAYGIQQEAVSPEANPLDLALQ